VLLLSSTFGGQDAVCCSLERVLGRLLMLVGALSRVGVRDRDGSVVFAASDRVGARRVITGMGGFSLTEILYSSLTASERVGSRAA